MRVFSKFQLRAMAGYFYFALKEEFTRRFQIKKKNIYMRQKYLPHLLKKLRFHDDFKAYC